jgi:cyclase
MSLTKRLVVCLDVRDGRVVKGVEFTGLRDIGDPVELAERYEREGADEIVYLDITATSDARGTLLGLACRTAERLFIPLTIGGGIRSADDMAAALRSGADKVAVNSAAVKRPALLTECADQFGAQCVVASIDAKREGLYWRVYTAGARTRTDLDAIEWAAECAARGAGEILLTSIDRDGARTGYDVALMRAVSSGVNVPVVASGGAGSARDVTDVLTSGGADAALIAGIVHDRITTIAELKRAMHDAHIPVRDFARAAA